METIVLASASPRRQAFFELLDLPFVCVPAMIDETPPEGMTPKETAEHLALRKAMSVAQTLENSLQKISRQDAETPRIRGAPKKQPYLRVANRRFDASSREDNGERFSAKNKRWVLGADTVVTLDGEILGKPACLQEARLMLQRLSGRRHEVITAMALVDMHKDSRPADCCSVSSLVEFAPLSEADIEWYLAKGEWEGAAGGYRLQECGACMIQSVQGSPSAVAGLPLRELYAMLKHNGYQFGA